MFSSANPLLPCCRRETGLITSWPGVCGRWGACWAACGGTRPSWWAPPAASCCTLWCCAAQVSHWSNSAAARARRRQSRVNRARYAEQLAAALREKLEIDIQLPVFFLDSHYSSWDRRERRQWETEVAGVI